MEKDEFSNAMRARGFIQQADGNWSKPTHIRNRDSRTPAELERYIRYGTMGAVRIQKSIGGQFLVRVTSFRRRLLDIDNLCEKYHVDLCRYAGIISSDAPGQTKIEVDQKKVGSKEREFVRIEIFKI